MLSGFLLVDANVLIDYQMSDISILSLVSQHIGPVHIVSSVLAEVEGLDESACERLGLRVIEPSLEQAKEAHQLKGRLSFQDSLCLVVCRDHTWICVTNDKALRRSCVEASVSLLWGLELMLELLKSGHLSVAVALDVAEQIHKANPVFLNQKVLEAFKDKARGLSP